jgi:CheY-like chemotaxis protein
MPHGGELTIATGNQHLDADYALQHAEVMPGDYAVLQVSDSGSGMSPEVLAQVFEPFFTTKPPGKGTGLGLSMVYGFIKQSGGHINIYSEVGVGTTVRLYLPRADAAADTREAVPAEVVRGGGETVLAVEDNPSLRRVVVRQLSELGYRVLEAETAAAALELLEHEPVAVVFTDVVLPGGISGYELARKVVGRWPAINVVLTSGFPENHFSADGAPSNLRLLSKPYGKEDIARVIREALDSKTPC